MSKTTHPTESRPPTPPLSALEEARAFIEEQAALLAAFHDFCEQRMPYSYHDGAQGGAIRARYFALENRRADRQEQEEVPVQ